MPWSAPYRRRTRPPGSGGGYWPASGRQDHPGAGNCPNRPAIYLDLEATADREKLSDPVLFLDRHVDKLVVLDEIHRMPALFKVLRGIVDAGRRSGRRTGRFLILGSASIDLLRQSGETLAGRIE